VFLTVRGTIGIVFALLVALAGITGFVPGEAGAWPLAVSVSASALEDGSLPDRFGEPTGVRHDDRQRRAELEQAFLEAEAEDDDDDAHSDLAAAAPSHRPVWSSSAAQAAWLWLAEVDTGHLLVSTGLARGPPVAA
jgi:hypothetical protein